LKSRHLKRLCRLGLNWLRQHLLVGKIYDTHRFPKSANAKKHCKYQGIMFFRKTVVFRFDGNIKNKVLVFNKQDE
jgi:hypothetical protein